MAKTGKEPAAWLPVCINKVLLEHSDAHSVLYSLCLISCCHGTAECPHQRNTGSQSLKIFTIWLFLEKTMGTGSKAGLDGQCPSRLMCSEGELWEGDCTCHGLIHDKFRGPCVVRRDGLVSGGRMGAGRVDPLVAPPFSFCFLAAIGWTAFLCHSLPPGCFCLGVW